MGATPLPSSADHKGEEDVPWLFLAASHTTQDPLTRCLLALVLSVQRLGLRAVLKVDRTAKSPTVLILEQCAEDALQVSKEFTLHPKEASGQISV